MANAITNKIKTYFTLYSGAEENGEVKTGIELKPMRNSDCSLEGATEKIESDVKLPDTRIKSTPENGSESSSGDVSTEWNIDEQDEWFAGVFCGDWQTTSEDDGNPIKKSLTLGDKTKTFTLLKKYPQNPIAYQHFKKCFINQVQISMATDDFVKLSWNFMGSNNPKKENSDPLTSFNPVYKDALTTKSYITNSGFLKIGDNVSSLAPMRQASNFEVTINNNMEKTPALFEKESIENTLGDFDVSGTIDIYNADDIAHTLYNEAVDGKDKVLQVQLSRKVGDKTTSYTLTLNVHLDAPTESKDGNKFKFSLPFTLNAVTDLKLEKEESNS